MFVSRLTGGLLVALTVFCSAAIAAEWNTNSKGVVLDGHDVVAYRTADRAVQGSSAFQSRYEGGIFEFANAENKALFDAEPSRYAPKYNGYCAFAMGAKNAKVPANADTFKLYNGELLVFFNDLHDGQKFNTKIPWNANEQALFEKAEANWRVQAR